MEDRRSSNATLGRYVCTNSRTGPPQAQGIGQDLVADLALHPGRFLPVTGRGVLSPHVGVVGVVARELEAAVRAGLLVVVGVPVPHQGLDVRVLPAADIANA